MRKKAKIEDEGERMKDERAEVGEGLALEEITNYDGLTRC
jgi:hypothetical protein